jgi:hypothetical protein
MNQTLKPHLEELFVTRSCTHFPSLGALSLCMLVFCDLHGHLGGIASKVKPCMSDSLISEHILEKRIYIARLVFYMICR